MDWFDTRGYDRVYETPRDMRYERQEANTLIIHSGLASVKPDGRGSPIIKTKWKKLDSLGDSDLAKKCNPEIKDVYLIFDKVSRFSSEQIKSLKKYFEESYDYCIAIHN
jgi:hypothetical protein